MSVISFGSEDKKRDLSRRDSLTTVYSSNSRLNLLQKRKRANALNGTSSYPGIKMGDKFVTQRVLSAKTHKVKQLQNQLADAHYHLQELSNENKMLKNMQKKQENALRRYESSNAELPQVLNSHSEEMRVQQTKFKQLKQQLKEVTQKLKERDMQLQQLRDDHQHLLDLSKDRNLLDREKLQAQVTELSAKVLQQNETISQLQRRITLETKNFKHQLQNEINKHKDTRHDLELAVTNADKLSTIIEMKEKMINCAALRTSVKSPVKSQQGQTSQREGGGTHRPAVRKFGQDRGDHKRIDEIRHTSMSMLERLEHSNVNTQPHEEDTSPVPEPRYRLTRNRASSNSSKSTPTPNQTRKSSKGSEEMDELAKTVQNGMADLALFDEPSYARESPEDMQRRMEQMKQELMVKIKKGEETISRRPSALRKRSTDESISATVYESGSNERPKSRTGQHSAVSFYEDKKADDTSIISTVSVKSKINEIDKVEPERKLSGKKIEKYCDNIISGIEKSSKLIDRHITEFKSSKITSDRIVEQLQAVDNLNELVNVQENISEKTLQELNNNFKILTEQVSENVMPMARKRSLSGRNSKPDDSNNLFGDSGLTNQDLLDDLLKRK